jgi:DNA polymerase V
LAKIANHIAKKNKFRNVFNLSDPALQDIILADFKVEDIWGIGYQSSMKLHDLGIATAKQLRDTDAKLIRKYCSVLGERIVYELRGISCLSLAAFAEPSKNIRSSRSFGRLLSDYDDIAQALAHYTARACEKLRAQKSRTQGFYVFLRTNRFKMNEDYYSKGLTSSFITPTNDTRLIITQTKKALKTLFRPGLQYKKTGIVLLDLIPDSIEQQDLFSPVNHMKTNQIMHIMDKINKHMGQNALFIAAQGTERSWQVRCDKRSPCYTTNWQELAMVR